jgi:hypothetical protein
MSKVLKFEQRGWLTAEEMAERDSISLRTVYRRLKRGELESRDTPDGVRYRKPAGDTTSRSTDSLLTAADTAAVTDSTDSATDTATKPAQSAAHPSADTTDTDSLLTAGDTPAVSAVVEVLVGRLEKACGERGRMERELEDALEVAGQALDERDELLAELARWQALALQAVEEVERLRQLR